MKTFKDRDGKSWRVELSFALWRRIKAETEIDLLDVAMPDGKALGQLSKLENVGVVLWLYVEEQAVSEGIDRETFWRALHGEAIETAMEAVVEDLEDFSRSPQFSALRVAMMETSAEVERTREDIRNPEGTLRKKIRDVINQSESPAPQSTLGNTLASAPASSEGIPTTGSASETSISPPRDDDAILGTVQV
jgi:hypothetical protein